MRRYLLPILYTLILAACETTSITPTDQLELQPAAHPEYTSIASDVTPLPTGLISTATIAPSTAPSSTINLTDTSTPTATPAIRIDLSRFDMDVRPPIMVRHIYPLIARSDEIINLRFDFVCAYSSQSPDLTCIPSAILFVSYGAETDFSPVSLTETYEDGFRILSANLPASDENGQPLRYYLQINDPQVGLEIRYPTAGAIDLFVVDEFIPIELAAPPSVDVGELVFALPWGNGPEAVGLRDREGYPAREGPFAMDIAGDGRIALLDHVNERVLIYEPNNSSFTSIGLPFTFHNQGDMQFDSVGQLAILDAMGQPGENPGINIPQLYLLSLNGDINIAPVFATYPTMLTRELEVLDSYDGRLVVPFTPAGEENSREGQRLRYSPNLIYRFVENIYEAQFADVEAGLVFEVRSPDPLGAITLFKKVPMGYIVIFHADQIRAIWFDPSGRILKDITLPNQQFSEIYWLRQVVVNEAGDLFVFYSQEIGVEVRRIATP